MADKYTKEDAQLIIDILTAYHNRIFTNQHIISVLREKYEISVDPKMVAKYTDFMNSLPNPTKDYYEYLDENLIAFNETLARIPNG